MKNTKSEIKPIKIGKIIEPTYSFASQDYTNKFRPEKVKITNKVFREKFQCIVCQSNKSRVLKKKIN